MKEICKAIVWVKDFGNQEDIPYNPQKLFVMGHSAGGHLITCASLIEFHFKDIQLSPRDIKGIISISGVMDINSMSESPILRLIYTTQAFGCRADEWKIASPICFINKLIKDNVEFHENDHEQLPLAKGVQIPTKVKDIPPFLLLGAENDFKFLKRQLQSCYQAFVQAGIDVTCHEIPRCNHFSIIAAFGKNINQTEALCIRFIMDRC
ncbi:kynurenine formamidase-like [Tubulanus polymorphus]|uniref:kynurenine formamidase-like n=1 Tax=Tubulanus polymorphus TaxID=672921 RepID=UPI003DA697BF